MPQIFIKNGVSYIKKHKKRSFLFGFLFIFLLCLLIFNLADVISSVITNSKSIFVQNKIEVPSYSAYAVAVSNFQNEDDVNAISNQIKSMGGAGEVYKSGKTFVLISMYQNLSQAKEIQNNLLLLGNKCEIVEINVDFISKKYAESDAPKLVQYIKNFKNIYKNLFEISIKFDKEQLSINQVKSMVKEALNLVLNVGINLKNSVENSKLKEFLLLAYNSEKEALYNVLNFSSETSKKTNNQTDKMLQFSSLLKQSCFKTIFINANLAKKINNL